ncbi:UspA domain protein [Natrialba magadii ATCC 43099]|uniref:UspA domain protein n=1 Tax=Natrialba magadii (strain ATCC 43099 / DSM 3394 / CCM 3739 / CIP 104546 / IAM 13178 / JCM 8861 / NBRC 102185 / NCIMB 2190 / MS3) TaxID=547559 RepID=D3STA1_NATMM|nr:universal stress protein [Natrialba magadii]ADD06968.1 UspA domain protein [Natrialba magadii ATCC 43099]ELY28889.1 UspA domain-containing protein [Natrialba magadii ATCC 43099]
MYDTILVPTDGRPNTERAIEEAIGLADAHDATLHALYVINSAEIAPGVDFEDLEPIGESAVEYVADRAAVAGVSAVETCVQHGLRHQAILDYADAHDVDLIVVGRTSGLDRYLRKSVSKQVSEEASIPVLVVE